MERLRIRERINCSWHANETGRKIGEKEEKRKENASARIYRRGYRYSAFFVSRDKDDNVSGTPDVPPDLIYMLLAE